MKHKTLLLLTATFVVVGLLTSAHAEDAPSRMFKQADSNGDGLVSEAEFRALRSANWQRFDRNGDGVLTTDDAPAFGGRYRKALSGKLRALDTNQDGKISRAEYVDGPVQAFSIADGNGDGVLSPAEFEIAIHAVREE